MPSVVKYMVGVGSILSVAASVTSTELKNVPDVGLAETIGAVTSIVAS